MVRLARVFAVSMVFLVAGCSGDAPADPPMVQPDADMQPPTGCNADFACGDGQVCVDGECREGQCNIERTCPMNQRCNPETFTCEDAGPARCEDEDDCDVGFCIEGRCADVQCVDDDDCDPNEQCSPQNRCLPRIADCVDGDEDGYGIGMECLGFDCDDGNPDINPGVVEDGDNLCDDGIDQDCSGGDARCGEQDRDGDGFTDLGGDCDDTIAEVNPEAEEVPYNGRDDDCNEETSDSDLDGDGFVASQVGGDDCDDSAAQINPEGREIPGNGVDEDCDGEDREPNDEDADMDGFSEVDGDCNDGDPAVNPEAEEVPYNGKDDDCNRATPDNDLDNDGFPSPIDCADDDPRVNPDEPEVYYNGKDDDCDEATIDDDADGDGFVGVDAGGDDCNDQSPSVNPSVPEENYNGIDDDCDPDSPDDDLDGDGFARAEDCDDSDPARNPGVTENATTLCSDGVDHDCRGGDVECDDDAVDSDGDGVPDDQDCAPENPDVPGPAEIVGNGIDDDCDPSTPDVPDPCDDDAFDVAAPNNTPDVATGVDDGNTTGVQYGGLVICGGDDDWYAIELAVGDGLEVDIFFEHAEGDIDMSLARLLPDGTTQLVDSSVSVQNQETVYLPRAIEAGTYVVRVFGYAGAGGDYQMTVNVFSGCVDDAEGAAGEHGDDRTSATRLPPVDETRQICDYDEDWYRFTVNNATDVRVDVLFPHADGDIDVELRDAAGGVVNRGISGTDNELIEQRLDPGDYTLRVYGFQGATNTYSVFVTSGETDSIVVSDDLERGVPDFADGVAGVLEVDLEVDAPAGAIISELVLQDLIVEHPWLPDLVVTLMWNDEPVVVVWNRDGNNNDGTDGGLDDDFFFGTGSNIDFDNRRYREFAGLPARGTFTLMIQDLAGQDIGTYENVRVEVTYLVPF